MEITRAGSGDFDSQVQSTGSKAALRLMALGGAYYRWTGSAAACQGSADPPEADEVIEPAALLPPLGAASRVGVETVNQVPAVHYHFDQSALPHFKSNGGMSGDVWLAENGGYVVRYSLTAAAPQKPSGKGLEVSQSYQYELTPDGLALTLPEGCAPVPVDLPVVEGAQNVHRAGGLVTFDTAANPREVISFYEQNLPALGWKAETAGPAGEVSLPVYVDFTQDGLRLTVNLTSKEDHTEAVATTAVALVVVDAAAQAAQAPHPTQEAPSGPGEPLPTIDPAQSGLPSNVPLYPGATSLIQAGSAVMFQSTDPWEDVAGYYRTQLEVLGWAAESEQTLENGVSMIWNQNGEMLIVNIMASDDQTQIVVALPE